MEKSVICKKIFIFIVLATLCVELSNLPRTEATFCDNDSQCLYYAPICKIRDEISYCDTNLHFKLRIKRILKKSKRNIYYGEEFAQQENLHLCRTCSILYGDVESSENRGNDMSKG
ncbi:hypothetical protein ACET3Z_031923 [Daucus carota]